MKQSLILSSDFVVIIICCLGAMKIKDSVEQMTLDLIFQNCNVTQEVSVTIPSADLTTSGFILFAVIRREKIQAFEDVV